MDDSTLFGERKCVDEIIVIYRLIIRYPPFVIVSQK